MASANLFNNNIYSDEDLDAIWKKAAVTPNSDPSTWRKDVAGAWIKRSEYGNRDSEYGWEVDHIIPKSKGGKTELGNLRPLQHQNNASKGNNYPEWVAVVTSDGRVHNTDCSKKIRE